jgi:hypothetical protein
MYLETAKHDILSLMHHYSFSTCESISDSPRRVKLWMEMVSEIAFEYDFLLSALLAVTSMHLTLLHPSESNNKTASTYHEAVLAQFNS